MRAPRRLFCTALATLCALAAGAMPPACAAEPQAGNQYLTLATAQPTDTGKKVEVIEFFAYYCPHCQAFEPQLAAWVKKQGADIVFKRVHVTAGASALPQQRLFYTLDAMGLLEQYHAKVFDAMHVQRLRLGSDEQVLDWAANAGIDRAKFTDVYRSFGIQARLRRATAMMDAYGVEYWPMIVVDGRFVTSPSQAGKSLQGSSEAEQQQAALGIMDFLVAKAKADKDKQ
jgi:protein dithiol oxidoreductase (disulfide-forming)